MKERLQIDAFYPAINDIEDAALRKVVDQVFQDLWQQSRWTDLSQLPTSGEISYPNLPHTQCILEIVLAVAASFEKYHGVKVNRDILIASAILQDASKLVEYEPGPDGTAQRTPIGKQYLHGFWCAHLGAKYGLPHEVCHIILTHSPGSAKFPDSLEGKILYYVDQLDVIAIHKDRWKKTITISK